MNKYAVKHNYGKYVYKYVIYNRKGFTHYGLITL